MAELKFDRESVQNLYRLKCYLMEEIKKLREICKEAAEFYDRMSLSSLEHAAKYGPDVEPPTSKDCLAIRQKLEDAQRLKKSLTCISCGALLTTNDTFDTCVECTVHLENLQSEEKHVKHRVTKDMAIDAGDPDLEGELI